MNANGIATFGIGLGVFITLATLCLFAIILGGVGFFVLRMVRKSQALGEAAKTWPSTTGTVLQGFVDVSNRTSGNNHRSTSYTPKVIYTFTANGQTYQGDTVRVGIVVQRGGYNGAQAIVDRYPAGSTVTVYYNPANPSQAVLER